jgi:hypothetical protein
MIIDKLKNNDTVSARIHTIELSQWDEQQIHMLLQKGDIPSPWVIELIQIHEYIYGSLINLVEAKEILDKRNNEK